MCSYRHERYHEHLSEGELLARLRAQLAWVLSNHHISDFQMVKIFTSGSFFDPHEVPVRFREECAKAFAGRIVVAETRPEYITEETIRNFVDAIEDGNHRIPLYCAIGLETSNDRIREKSIDKGFLFADFVEASRIAHSAGAGVKAYLLAKPLFLTEGEAIRDMKQSIHDTAGHAEIVSMNPCTVQKNTSLEYYWRRGAYRPPYLWSILEILADAPIHVTCDPLGGGQKRGPHNCGKCDYDIVRGIRDYSLNGDRELIGALLDIKCACREEWEFIVQNEHPYAMPLTR
jgi:radical SAM enzyme (TIGR01210 family)